MFKIRGTVDSIALFQCHAIQVSLLDFAHPSAPRREKISICDRLEKGKLSLQNVEFIYIYMLCKKNGTVRKLFFYTDIYL